MNLFSQGIDPQIDFSDIDRDPRTVEYCNQLPVHRAPPVGGDLSTRPSGSHQDAIKKGFEDMDKSFQGGREGVDDLDWACPTCRSTRTTSAGPTRRSSRQQPVRQGRVSHLLKAEHGLDLPRRLQVEFSQVVQKRTDAEGGELAAPRSGRVRRRVPEAEVEGRGR